MTNLENAIGMAMLDHVNGFMMLLDIPDTPPSVNDTYLPVIIKGTPRIVKSKKVKQYQRDLALRLRSKANKSNFTPSRNLALWLHLKLKKGRDTDNPLKSIQDAIAAALKINDCTIDLTIISREVVPENQQGISITIYNLKEEA